MDATIAYENEKLACLWTWWFGTPQTVHIHWRVTKIDPDMSETELRDDLYDRWSEKELMLKHFHLYGHFPALINKEEINGNFP